MKINLMDEGCVPEYKVGFESLFCTSVMKVLFLYVQSPIDKPNNSNESMSATGRHFFPFRNEFEGRLFV